VARMLVVNLRPLIYWLTEIPLLPRELDNFAFADA
jgi:hypothetical protein